MQPRFDRGYTGHEHMCGFGLINMNGRLYDPYLQRFLSPDPYVQAPGNAQNYNRYSYCLNNPLMFTDPSGEIIFAPILIGMAVGALIGAGTSAAIYATTTLLSGQDWSWRQFGLSAAFGAVGGALGGGLGALGSQLGTFGQSLGYNILSNIAGNSATTLAFGGDISMGSLAGMALGGMVGNAFGNFNGVSGGALKNIMAEMGFGIAKGAYTGALGGFSGAIIDGKDPSEGFVNGFKYGAISGGTMAGLNIITMGAAYRPDKDYGFSDSDRPVYRKGTFITRRMGSGCAVGRNILVHKQKTWFATDFIEAHESFHYIQQQDMGFANFYCETARQYLTLGFRSAYNNSSSLEWQTDHFGYQRTGYIGW